MEPRAAFQHFADGASLELEDLSCAMIAVFGFKFKKQDLRDLMEHYAQEGPEGLKSIEKPFASKRKKKKKEDGRHFTSVFAETASRSDGALNLEAFLLLVEDRRRILGERDRTLRLPGAELVSFFFK